MAITPEQREIRKAGLFSSDIARIMTGHGVQVALQKLGHIEDNGDDFEELQEFKIGKLAEPFILDAYEKKMGCTLVRDLDTQMHPDIPWMGCHLDARWTRNVESKTVRKELRYHWGDGGDEIPDYPLWQTIVQMSVTGLLVTDVPVCFLTLNNVRSLLAKEEPIITIFQVQRDFELEDYMIKKATHVKNCIDRGITPEPENLDDIKLIYSKAIDPAVQATPEMLEYWHEIVEVKKVLKEYEQKEKDLKFKMQSYMKAADALVLTDNVRPLVTWRNDADGERFEKERFEKEHPVLYKSYLKDKLGARKFLVKIPKEKK